MTASLFRRPPGVPSLWALAALILALAPYGFSSSHAVSVLSQMGIAIIACLAYNLLLGQGGMLSFGQAVYSGLGGFTAIHALNGVASGVVSVPTSLIPLLGGLAGLVFAGLFGYVTTRKGGTAFAMITLGVGELLYATTVMLPGWFGGEAGIAANRAAGAPFLSITFGPPIQMYYLIAFYTLVCSVAMYGFTRTPLGHILRAVRDNPERAEFIGYDARRVRYLTFVVAGFFSGVSGGLAALNFELVTSESLSSVRSGALMVFTFLGGTGYFLGPVLGAILMVLVSSVFSAITPAWHLYLGLLFMLVVVASPGGLAGWLVNGFQGARAGVWRDKPLQRIGQAVGALLILAGGGALVEMTYFIQLQGDFGTVLTYLGFQLSVRSPATWCLAAALMLAGLGLWGVVWTQRRAAGRGPKEQA